MKVNYSFAICLLVVGMIEVHSQHGPDVSIAQGIIQPPNVIDLVVSELPNMETSHDRRYSKMINAGIRAKRENPRNSQMMKDKNERRSEAAEVTLMTNDRIEEARNLANQRNAHLPPEQRTRAVNQHVEDVRNDISVIMLSERDQRMNQRDRH